MKRILPVFLATGILLSCTIRKARESMLLDSSLVDLKGKPSVTIIVNSTRDTLALGATIFGMIPLTEESSKIRLAPAETDTLTFSQSYPDFIYLRNGEIDLKIFNAPGKQLICNIHDPTPGRFKISFSGDLSQINDYYLAHQNHFGANYENNRPYFLAGDTVKNFDSYPGVVDSITGMSLAFLECYTLPLPEWFVLHEKARLRFKSGFIKHNCLLTKEFYEARIVTKSPSYFDFDKALSLRDSHIVLCSEYLWYAHHRLHHYPKGTKPLDQLPFEYHIIDSLLGSSAIGDMLRMAQLSMAVMSSLPKFRDQLAKVNFGDSTYRMVLDSLVKNRLGIPTIGKLSPDPLLSDDKGNRVQLSKYKGNVLLVNFWATWCGPCIREFPFENEIHQKYKGRGFVIVNICVESEEEKWKALTKEHELKMVNLFYSPDEYHLLRKAFDLGGFPRSVLIDKDFVIRENYATRASSLKDSGIENWIAGEF